MGLIILEALVISVISITGLNMIYNIDNVLINSGVMCVIIAGAFFILNSEEKKKQNISSEEKREFIQQREKEIEKLSNSVDQVRQSFLTVAHELKEDNNTLIESMNKSIEKLAQNMMSIEKKLDSAVSSVQSLEEIKEETCTISKLIEQQNKITMMVDKALGKSLEECRNMKESFEDLIRKSAEESNEIRGEIKKTIESIGDKNLTEICEVLSRNGERIESIDEKINITEEINMNIELLSKGLEDQGRIINKFKKTYEEAVEESEEHRENLIASYEKIYNESLKQIIELTNKNQYIVQLLMDNYKVLNAVMDN